MTRKKGIDIEIDSLTNSIVNVISGEVFETEFSKVSKKEIHKKDWLFDWHKELKEKRCQVFKMTTIENRNIIQGLVSVIIEDKYITVNVIENAKFNRGKDKVYLGVGGNMFAFACKRSIDMGFGGFVGFMAKTALIKHYQETLGAEIALGQRMFINNISAEKLINQYFKTKKT